MMNLFTRLDGTSLPQIGGAKEVEKIFCPGG